MIKWIISILFGEKLDKMEPTTDTIFHLESDYLIIFLGDLGKSFILELTRVLILSPASFMLSKLLQFQKAVLPATLTTDCSCFLLFTLKRWMITTPCPLRLHNLVCTKTFREPKEWDKWNNTFIMTRRALRWSIEFLKTYLIYFQNKNNPNVNIHLWHPKIFRE